MLVLITFNEKTRYYDWTVGHLTGRCLTQTKALQHALMAEFCREMTIEEFHDAKQVLIDVSNSGRKTQEVIIRYLEQIK